ncbi:cytochrome P450 [Deinococcus alpinitundrae]|uniref:cytochrome P450 n=1 Tax=Deinococcus alpinitundrae TaxID=468913 RepID=UPI00137B7674|nr:cytochrome P450 [Deinococcus alpinitundrae]
MTQMPNPLQAVTHPDAEALYEQLLCQPFHYSPLAKCWVATSSEEVVTVLDDPRCRVRPVHQPVPPFLSGSVAGEIFALLARMTEGEGHLQIKASLIQSLEHFSEHEIRIQVATVATALQAESPLEFAYQMPVLSMGKLLGVPAVELDQLAILVKAFTACITPGSPSHEVQEGIHAAPSLWRFMEERLDSTFVSSLPQKTRVANAIGLLWQGYDSTASLILHGMLALEHRLLPVDWNAFLTELIRVAAPIQNTRRFMGEAGVLLEQNVEAGDTVLLLLAAANRTATGAGLSFGHGVHRCPGQRLATLIAEIALACWHGSRTPAPLFHSGFKPSLNARIPLLEALQ